MLTPSRDDISRFVSTLFRYADEGSFISLRAFDQHDRGRPALFIKGVACEGDLSRVVAQAEFAAERSANSDVPSVFAPPVATFNNPDRARTMDVQNGVAISVEIDSGDPATALRRLEGVLGPASIVVQSGGEWIDPETGEAHPKTHLHWRLSEPTSETSDHNRLQYARILAAKLVGGDPTASPPAHPLRWPGSWNRKTVPRIAKITGGNEAAEVHLEYAIERLEEATDAAGFEVDDGPRVSGTPTADMEHVTAAMAHLANRDVHWDEWVRLGMAVYRASGGSSIGLDAWCAWSAKSPKHDDQACVDRWAHFGTSPPQRVGAGTIFFLAKTEGWSRPARDVVQQEPPESHPDDPGYDASYDSPADKVAALPKDTKAIWSSADDWDEAAIPQRPWIAKGYLMRGSVALAAGSGSAGKSSIGVAWGVAAVLGRTWSRFKPCTPCIVSIYNVEDDDDEQKRRISATLRQFRADPIALKGRLYRLGATNVGTLLERNPVTNLLQLTAAMNELIEHLEAVRPDILILDPLVELHNADENDNTALRGVMATMRALAVRFNMAVMLVHHARKGSAGDAGDPDMIRGAGAIVGAARIALTVSTMTEDEAEEMNLPSKDRHDYFRVDGAKQNYARVEMAEWFKREVYRLGNDEDVVAAEPWRAPSVWREMTTELIGQALDRLSAGPLPGALYSATKRGASNARWAGQVLMDVFDQSEPQAKTVIATWLKSGVLVETTYRDTNEGKDRIGVKIDRSRVAA